jgi:hypothetical protein
MCLFEFLQQQQTTTTALTSLPGFGGHSPERFEDFWKKTNRQNFNARGTRPNEEGQQKQGPHRDRADFALDSKRS